MEKIMKQEIIGYIIIFAFCMGWIDWAWIFGIESSKSYTWWYLIVEANNFMETNS
jgi:hypothetical protein